MIKIKSEHVLVMFMAQISVLHDRISKWSKTNSELAFVFFRTRISVVHDRITKWSKIRSEQALVFFRARISVVHDKITKWLKRSELPYTHPERLSDVMDLIQVLARHGYRERSNKGITENLQGTPKSAKTWQDIAEQHPEFFRLKEDKDKRLRIALIPRHVLSKYKDGKKELPSDYISILLEAAIRLHDRQTEGAS